MANITDEEEPRRNNERKLESGGTSSHHSQTVVGATVCGIPHKQIVVDPLPIVAQLSL